MEDESDDEPARPPFRWNWQVVFMAGFTAAALAIPLMGVVWFASGYVPSAVAPAKPAAESPALRASLEQAAAGTLAVGPISGERPVIEIAVVEAERGAKGQALREAVAGLGGSVVEVEPGRRFLVTAPAGGFEAVSQALGAKIAAPPASAANGDGFFEVRFP